MKKKMLRKMLLLLLLLGIPVASSLQAAPIFVQTLGVDFTTLLGGAAVPIGTLLDTDFSGGNLSARVYSQAFSDGAGHYLYLYQVRNTGTAGSEVVTRFTASPYTQASSSTPLGYLTANIPAGFLAGDQNPLYGDVDADSGPTIGFNFPVGNPIYGMPDSYILPGKSSKVLYIQSNLPPGLTVGNVINGGVHSGDVVGPVPEPTLIALLGLGTIMLRKTKR